MDLVAVLHNIRSLHNVGSIFRTADAAGIGHLYLCGITPGPFDRFGRVRLPLSKVALGAERTVPWSHHGRTAVLLARLRKEGYKIYAVEQAGNSIVYSKIQPGRNDKIALVLGAEVRGLPPSVLKAADRTLEIPMLGRKESLNVAVAFGIVAFGLRAYHNVDT